MKKIITILLITFGLTACEFDKGFEDLNIDPTKSSQINVNNKFASVVLRTSGGRYENWRANLIYSSTMMQHFAATAGYWVGDKYFQNRGYATSLWDRGYEEQVKEIEDIIFQLTEEGNTSAKLGIARILRVFIYHRITDLHGDIPYSEAGKGFISGILRPKYDPQSEIYADMLKELDEAVDQISGEGYGTDDLLFQGDSEKWKKFGNSMMLRLGMRLSKVDNTAAQSWVSKAISKGVMTSNDDIAYVEHATGPDGINKNGNGEVFTADNNMRLSKTFVDFLQNDPRLPVLGSRRGDGSTALADLTEGLPNGLDGDLVKEQFGYENLDNFVEPNRKVITGEDAPMFFQTYAEVSLLVAEAIIRGWVTGDAEAAYKDGVRGAMKMLSLYGDGGVIDDTAIEAYIASRSFSGSNEEKLSEIGWQYWAATFLNEYETYANWRRTGIPELVPVNYPGNVTNGSIPRRLLYPSSEEVNNPENNAAAVARQGENNFTTRVWWDN